MQTADQIVASYPEVFQRELGTLPGTVDIEVEQDATPVVALPRRVPVSPGSQTEGRVGSITAAGGQSSNR